MKWFNVILVSLLIGCSQLFAADTTNVVVNYLESDYSILYYGPAKMGKAGGTDNSITQYMNIEGLDFTNGLGHIQIWATDITGTEDYNGYIEFSNSTTGTTFQSLATDGDLDQMTTTVKLDTVGYANGIKTHGAKYMRLKFDGQTGNPHSLVINWYIYLVKPVSVVGKRIAHVGSYL